MSGSLLGLYYDFSIFSAVITDLCRVTASGSDRTSYIRIFNRRYSTVGRPSTTEPAEEGVRDCRPRARTAVIGGTG